MENNINTKSTIPSKRLKDFNSIEAELLHSIIIGGDCVGYTELLVSHNTVVQIQPAPTITPQKALISIEKDPTATAEILVRFTPDEISTPTSILGIPLGDGGTYWVCGYENIKNFKVTGCEIGKTHKMYVVYFQ